MPLQKIEHFDPNYRETIEGNDIKGMGVYTQGTNEKIGTVSDVIVDDQGNFRYFVVDLGLWIFGKKVLLPVGRTQIDANADRVFVGITRAQAENLPEYNDRTALDNNYEEQVRGVYRPTTTMDAASSAYQQDASLYEMNDQDHASIKLYQERLIANKKRVKSGEVAIGKHVETQTAHVSVPIEKERVVIERVTPADAGRAVDPGSVHFGEGQVARMEIYEETPDIHKEAFVREEIKVKKVVDRDTVEAQDTVRREELDVSTDGRPVVDRDKQI